MSIDSCTERVFQGLLVVCAQVLALPRSLLSSSTGGFWLVVHSSRTLWWKLFVFSLKAVCKYASYSALGIASLSQGIFYSNSPLDGAKREPLSQPMVYCFWYQWWRLVLLFWNLAVLRYNREVIGSKWAVHARHSKSAAFQATRKRK